MAGAVDYQVGPGKTYTELHLVPWESLKAGDTVRIFHRATAYKGKFLIAAQGTAAAPVRICGVRGPANERPIIDGNGAISRTALAADYGSNTDIGGITVGGIHQARSIIVIKPLAAAQPYAAYPRYIQIDGLTITRAHPNYTFIDAAGKTKPYEAFGAAIWIDRGQHITIADNEISDSQMAVFSKSTDDGDFAVTKDIRITGNYFWGHGIVDDVHMHTTYTESSGIVMEFNRYGTMRSGAAGNSIKDRSVGTVVRYNRIEDGAHAIDLVEAEDFPSTAKADPAYRSTFVYGNLISKIADLGSFIHYGGDHYDSTPGASWGEPIFRKGTLYFFNNTVMVNGTDAALFQVSTTDEVAEIWNNVFVFAPTIKAGYSNMRQTSEISSPWTPGGIVNLGKNWISTGWSDSDPYHTVPGKLNITVGQIASTTSPLDASTFVPLAGSTVVDSGVAGPAAASAYTVNYQISSTGVPSARVVKGSAIDMGALER
ncbi:MAG: hypothetical protein IPG93_24850 [Burkholderiales bacterium]|nr:hypothetical protein [Burkholderiales bacterium]